MAAIKQIIVIAQEQGLETIAKALESAYMDNINCSMGTRKEVEAIKEHMPRFMREHGFPINALACSDEAAPRELSESTMINVAGYHCEPHTDQMKIMTPTIFIGNKKKDKFSK